MEILFLVKIILTLTVLLVPWIAFMFIDLFNTYPQYQYKGYVFQFLFIFQIYLFNVFLWNYIKINT